MRLKNRSEPKTHRALEIVSKLELTLNQISSSVNDLYLAISAMGKKSIKTDQDHGVLKKIRLDSLLSKMTNLLTEEFSPLFTQYSEFISSGQFAHNEAHFSEDQAEVTSIGSDHRKNSQNHRSSRWRNCMVATTRLWFPPRLLGFPTRATK
ncbi:hypothetical protein PSHT_06710 [Puccinia striiformis]|uniref:Uncharacterized protein n=1 Tax=Puccinia striiformis TaxID=27350 RepID=A0A2S4W4Y2_9BASI|nr:hypothetical protein PSHT_06710 [Puccinia striiformis]